jgi:hypothetical protein
MMHTKAVNENHYGGPLAVVRADGRVGRGWRRLLQVERWLMPWSRLRVTAADGGPPQWPLPWR